MQTHTLTGEFPSEAIARSVIRELTALFREHAREVDAADTIDGWMTSNACRRLAARHEFIWAEDEGLPFADLASGRFVDALPEIARNGRQVVVFCHYGAGFGSLPLYFAALGAKAKRFSFPSITVGFDLPAGARGDALTGALVRFFDQARPLVDLTKAPIRSPWLGRETWRPLVIVTSDLVAWSIIGRRFEFVLSTTLRDVSNVAGWLRAAGAKRLDITYCEEDGVARVREGIEVQSDCAIRWAAFERILGRAQPLTDGKNIVGYALELRGEPAPERSGLRHWDLARSVDGIALTPKMLPSIRDRALRVGTMTLRIDRGPDPWRRIALRLRVTR